MAPIMGIIFVIFTKKPIGNIINYVHKINMKKKIHKNKWIDRYLCSL